MLEAVRVLSVNREPEEALIDPDRTKGLPSFLTRKAYNCAVTQVGNEYIMLIRGVGYEDTISRIGIGRSTDGINFTIDPEPALEPVGTQDNQGVEDPRIAYMDEPVTINGNDYRYLVSYTAVENSTARIAIVGTNDFREFSHPLLMLPEWDRNRPENERDWWNTRRGREDIFPGFDTNEAWNDAVHANWTKAAGIFPKKFDGKYAALWGEWRIRMAFSDDLIHWETQDDPIISAREGHFDSAYVEMGPAPIQTDKGWLVFYNGVNTLGQEGRVYGVGWALLDLEDPTKVLGRCEEPILVPETEDEITGEIDIVDLGGLTWKNLTEQDFAAVKDTIPMAVFCNGALQIDGNTFALYYGAGDKRVKRAVVRIDFN